MKDKMLTVPEIGMIAITRVALGLGAGLLLAGRLNRDQRKAAGWALFSAGLATTVPIAVGLVRRRTISENPMTLVA